ncbi:MAG: methyl-viologen-reducing hydrogenase delta subunit [Actinobacteria bacterium]|nr:methyl-viologen-reducing hydrogenase delta subunit [Actinomycetota bacterium]
MGNAEFEPLIIAFCCNWCSYAGADLAGVSRQQYPPNVRIIRVMCSGMVHPNLVINALTKGADGVIGLENERFRLEWVSASEGTKFAGVMKEFTEEIRKLGPSPYKT